MQSQLHPTRCPLKFLLILIMTLMVIGGVGASDFTYSAGSYPNTETCLAQPTIDFPDSVTISKTYLFFTKCSNPVDFNSGDFVSVWVKDMSGSPIKTISESVKTDTGIVWTAPLTNNTGQAWQYFVIDSSEFDCNSTGVDYNLVVSWDAQSASKIFKVFCPVLKVKHYKLNVPWTESFIVRVEVYDDIGNRLKGIPCQSFILDATINDDMNNVSIKQKTETIFTNNSGIVEFEFASGALSQMLINYDYSVVIECLGTDTNFLFTVGTPDEQTIRNPIYYLIVWLSDNWVPVIFGIICAMLVIGVIFAIIQKRD